MDLKAHKKSHQHKKYRVKTQERFAKKFPYRFSWLAEPNPKSLQSWEVVSHSAREQLPLQKRLVPTRSIPVRGLGAPDFTSLVCSRQPPPPPHSLWELKLLNHRFPRQGVCTLAALHASVYHPLASEAAGPPGGIS
ncbi:PREDICTED: uncharacterized protein C3orf22 homolog [Galeopterus variegatus]|uniref:Uncharacterized protein C3orf22 homolog n=1 Tax=Galeopterus variegatus TaxID=482537 RepID=A0ABM0RBM8_GALVR|nr:PREDICTED: uncharacterized protein C3orf22 homolog [Galeopterus variegatus]